MPRQPERVCDPATVAIDSQLLVFDCMCRKPRQEFKLKPRLLLPGTTNFGEIGWRPLPKIAVSRSDARSIRRHALQNFHDVYDA